MREKVEFKTIKVGDAFLLREKGVVYIREDRHYAMRITGTKRFRLRFVYPCDKVIWLGKVVDVVTEI